MYSFTQQGCICPLKVELKKLTIEKLRYEKVIQYLKEEMQMLAEQLANLQNILSASNTNTIEENTQLARTIGELQVVNTQLQDEIAKQVQINQSNAAHINDLEGLLEEKEAELQQLQNALAEREANLEASIMQVTEQQRFIEQVRTHYCVQKYQPTKIPFKIVFNYNDVLMHSQNTTTKKEQISVFTYS